MFTKEQVAATIDHAVLKPFMTDSDVIEACAIGKKYRVATVCVRPCDVALAADNLAQSGVGLAAVVGFPHGSNPSEIKAREAEVTISQGATEIDMVMNIGRFLSGDHDYVTRDISQVVTKAKPHGVLVKVILEVCYLDNSQIAEACTLAKKAGADFVKTSTGFGEGSATPEAVQIMIDTVGGDMKVKAAGGIRTWDAAVGYLIQGCSRLGAGATETIIEGGESKESY